MKNFLLALMIILAFTVTLKADGNTPWNMQLQDNGLYLNVNEQGQNDGWYWERYSTCGCRYSCNCYKYGWRKVRRVATIPNPREDGFDEKYLNTFYNILKWRNQEKMVDKLLELSGDDAVVEGFSEYRTTKTVRRGYGYTPNGTTYSSYSYYGNGPNDELGYSQHTAERSLDRAYGLVEKLAAKESHRADVALEFQKNLMAYQGFKDMLQITPQEETTTWEREGTRSSTYREKAGAGDPLEDMWVSQGERLNRKDCMGCHSGTKVSKDFDVTQYHLITPEEVDDVWEMIEGHLNHTIKPGMPKGKPKYSDAKKSAYKAYFYSKAGKAQPEAPPKELPPPPQEQ